jgi:hypothetical protein
VTEPTPIKSHRRYTKRQKATAVIAAEMATVAAASDQLGIPETNIRQWRASEEYAELRAKTRGDMADEMRVLAQLAAAELAAKLRAHEIDPRDLVIMLGVAIDKGQLLSGDATSRTESRSLSEGLDDHERAALKEVLREAIEVAE